MVGSSSSLLWGASSEGAFSYKMRNSTQALSNHGVSSQAMVERVLFDASGSSPTYQDSAPVRPLSLTTAFLIKH